MNWEVETVKSKALFFNLKRPFLSSSLMKENIRKLWPLCLLLILMYVLTTAFTILIPSSDEMVFHSEACFGNNHPIYLLGLVVFPILTSVLVFKYLHKQGGTAVLHSMPFTRTSLLFTNYLSGAIVIILPVIVNAVIMLPVGHYVKNRAKSSNNLVSTETFENIPFEPYSATHILNWLAVSVLIVIFIYTLSVLAGMVSGNITMHTINALLINFAPVYLFFIVGSYLDAELIGFNFGDFLTTNIKWFSPLFDGDGVLSMSRWVIYLCIIIIGILVTNLLYEKRKLEKTGDSLVFKFMTPVVIFLIAVMGTSMISMYAFFFNGKTGIAFYAAVAVVSIIALIATNMIVQRTPKIFNMKTLKSIIAYGLIVGIFMSCVSFDVLGIESKVPKAIDVKSISINAPVLANKPYRESGDSFDNYFTMKQFLFKSEDAIKYITAFHKDMVNDPQLLLKSETSRIYGSYDEWTLNIDYSLASGKVSREYNVTTADFQENKNLMKLIETEEYKRNLSLEALGYDRIKDPSLSVSYVTKVEFDPENSEYDELSGSYESNTSQLFLHQDEKKELLNCLDKDFMEQTAEELLSKERPLADILMTVKSNKKSSDPNDHTERMINYVIPNTYDHTIKWLKDKDYYNKLVYTAKDIAEIKVEVVEDNQVKNTYKVTDPAEIAALYKNSKSTFNDDYEYAVLSITFNDDAMRRIRSLGSNDGSASGEAMDRNSLEGNLSYDGVINRCYIKEGQKAYKDLIKQK